MTFSKFIEDRLGRLLLRGSLVAGAAVFLLLTGTQPGILLLLLLLWGVFFVGSQVIEFLRFRNHIRELASILENLDRKYLFMECVPKPTTLQEEILFDLMRQAGKSMVEAVSDAQATTKEYREYIESWVHEIKTPITATRLICRNTDEKTRRKLTVELAQIENHVERALYYARAESPEQDFLVRQISLEDIAAEALEHHRSLLIQSGVRVETENLAHVVYTDGKWVCFLLGQLLQNAVRYRGEQPVIILSAKALENQVQLTVSDNGIGIPAHELPRVFDRGFTGSNGRSRGGSTGMGLYLCRKLAGHLGIQLDIQSVEGQSTSVRFTFPASH